MRYASMLVLGATLAVGAAVFWRSPIADRAIVALFARGDTPRKGR